MLFLTCGVVVFWMFQAGFWWGFWRGDDGWCGECEIELEAFPVVIFVRWEWRDELPFLMGYMFWWCKIGGDGPLPPPEFVWFL